MNDQIINDRYPWARVRLTPGAKTGSGLTNLFTDLAAGHYRLPVRSETSLSLIKPRKGTRISTAQVPLGRVTATRRLPVDPGRE
uniref:Uncharacterized protein n=1 Tax=Candidatus Kentrum eta TaxID=2126337 RepID=A0A450UU01_9GAMM|nr:MAG: hypothetical protein BECKH772A_GA0070896_1000442 [Candidatus Kentron sp. H]VFJ89428.1 MAG: hypothetical protein BECKH772B_GA0070898_1000442 [Candidatus Kentron sp. H]VFJ96039.1 MAG: hypothetical protein BECKH772C_GA0070978_1000443 [Candidatus Kentron sp. H]